VETRKPIFYDQKQRRWRRTRRTLEISGTLLTLLVVFFFITVARRPALPELLLPETRPALHAIRAKQLRHRPVVRRERKRKVAALGKTPVGYDPLRAAFYVSWDSASLAALEQHYRDLDLLIPEELHVISASGQLSPVDDPKLADWMQAKHIELPIMPLVNNFDGTNWRSKELAELLATPAARKQLIQGLIDYCTARHNPGLVLDFENLPDSSQPELDRFVHQLAGRMHAAGLKLMVALPPANPSFDYSSLGAQADAIILMDYDQHWGTSSPGPIAGQDWFLHGLRETLRRVPPAKLVVAIGNYSYDWPLPKRGGRHHAPPEAESISFQQALNRAAEANATVEFDPNSLNPNFSYFDQDNREHAVWFLDGVTAYNELRAAERAGVRGTALFRLGTEDPSLWTIWDTTRSDNTQRARLDDVPPGYDLILEGQGDIWRITATPESGHRTFQYDPATDAITDESFSSYPLAWRIAQLGATPHKIALSFDDGPDPRWTPEVLDILQAKHAPATFFVIGIAANNSLGLLHREYDQGEEIGNHTYTHPEFDLAPRAQLQIELNLTERLLESTLGIKTLLFRPPYGIDHQPDTASEVAPLPIPQSMGYLLVGGSIDPHDWGEVGGVPPPPARTIVDRVVHQAEAGQGNIVLLHDGGGDRSQTVAALPEIIDELRDRGFQLVTVSNLIGQTRTQVMPPLTPRERLVAEADGFVFDLFHSFRLAIAWSFLAGIFLVSLRALFVGLLALVEKLRPAPPERPDYRPMVSVLIPAYNEEPVITRTIGAVLASEYPRLEAIVVDDGSTDETFRLIQERFGEEPRVRLIHQANQGKAAALNRALAEATGPIIVTIDADTWIEPATVAKLVRHFADPRVAAVAGNVKVGNRDRWLTRWQALEYITSQNLEKRAFDLLNCITVVPGAVGALRRDLVREAGGFPADTVAEDTDLTLAIRRHGWRIVYDEEAIGHTEVPATTEALVHQRFRWTFGTLQALWKHRDTLGRPRYGTLGWIALPNIFLFQILLPLISPVIDLLFLSSLVLWGLGQFRIPMLPQLWTAEDVERSLIFFAGFMLIDFLACVIAFALEKKEDWSLLAPLLIQRFYYRQIMYLVIFQAVMRAVEGRAVGWRGAEPVGPTRAPSAAGA
jgi:cellulose synthase/poly-beta-1,6-N-acetylglucosamine synthase-like glycosyltransferase/spore germination protein YaaH/peptidoglycan/xylan/chitin deacetylase (PgdA/CDA1 family)